MYQASKPRWLQLNLTQFQLQHAMYPHNYFVRSLDSFILYKSQVPMAMFILFMLLLASFGTSQFNQTILFYYDTYCQEFARDALTESNTCNLNAWSDVHSASYNYTCGADYYVAFAVYDSSNVSLCKHFCCHGFSIPEQLSPS